MCVLLSALLCAHVQSSCQSKWVELLQAHPVCAPCLPAIFFATFASLAVHVLACYVGSLGSTQLDAISHMMAKQFVLHIACQATSFLIVCMHVSVVYSASVAEQSTLT
jgi:hypothetical protein